MVLSVFFSSRPNLYTKGSTQLGFVYVLLSCYIVGWVGRVWINVRHVVVNMNIAIFCMGFYVRGNKHLTLALCEFTFPLWVPQLG